MLDILPPSTLAFIKLISRQNALDPRFIPVDRHMQRWAESQGAGIPSEPDDVDYLASKFKMTPLPDDEAVLTDRIVLSAPYQWHILLVGWYRSPKPVHVIAEEMGLKRRELYHERKLVLAYVLGQLTAAGVRIAAY